MVVEDVLRRCRDAAAVASAYGLGTGASDPEADTPLDAHGRCDCSGFACWALGLKKYQPEEEWLRKATGGWYSTGGIFQSAIQRVGDFYQIPGPVVGAVLVYPPSWMAKGNPPVGHVAIVTDIEDDRTFRITHCSGGNYARLKKAIAETAPAAFTAIPAKAFAWCRSVEGGPPDARS